jgi:hypothetical protein
VFLLQLVGNVIVYDLPVLNHYDSVGLFSEVNGVGHENNGLTLGVQVLLEGVVEDVLADVGI